MLRRAFCILISAATIWSGAPVDSSMWANVTENSIENAIEDSLESSTENAIEDSLDSSIENAIEDGIESSTENAIEDSKEDGKENSKENVREYSKENSIENSTENNQAAGSESTTEYNQAANSEEDTEALSDTEACLEEVNYASSVNTSPVDSKTNASGRYVEGDFTWEDKSKKVLWAYSNESYATEVTIPDTCVEIESVAFSGNTTLKTINLSANLKKIDEWAFKGCTALTTINLEDTKLESVGAGSFQDCTSLTAVTFPKTFKENTATSLVYAPFNGCTSLATATFSEGATIVPDKLFYNLSSLTTVVLPDTITSIGDYAFGRCSKLTSISYPSSLISIGSNAFTNCTSLPNPSFTGNSLATIGDGAFSLCTALTSVTIPNTISSMGSGKLGAFSGCTSLATIVFEDGMIKIPDYACLGASGLTSLTIPESVSAIGAHSFEGCVKLTSVAFPSELEYIKEYAFSLCTGLTSLDLVDSDIKTIGPGAFRGCTSLPITITLPKDLRSNSLTNAQVGPFYGCTQITGVAFESGTTTVPAGILYNMTGLTTVTVPEGTTTLSASCFSGLTALTSVSLPGTLTTIKDSAFLNCTALTALTLPESVTSIGKSAFSGCTNGLTIKFGNQITSLPSTSSGSIVGDIKSGEITFNVLKGTTTDITLKKQGYSSYIKYIDGFDYVLGKDAVNNSANPYYYTAGDKVALASPTRAGYTFEGWYEDSKFKNKITGEYDTTGKSGTIVFYAKWNDGQSLNITLDYGNGTSQASDTISYGQKFSTLKDSAGNVVGLPTPTYAKHNFLGWYTAPQGTSGAANITEKTVAKESCTIYGWWQDLSSTSNYISVKDPVATCFYASGASETLTSEITVNGSAYITITDETLDADVYYTISTDGTSPSDPTASSTKYSGPISVISDSIIKFIAIRDSLSSSVISSTITVIEDSGWGDITADEQTNIFSGDSSKISDYAGKIWTSYNNRLYDSGDDVSISYTGTAQKLSGLRVYFGTTLLKEGTDYTIAYSNNKVVAAYDATTVKKGKTVSIAPTITIKGKGNYSGSIIRNFSIAAIDTTGRTDLTGSKVTVDKINNQIYTGSPITPDVRVRLKSTKDTLIKDTDYTVSFLNNTNAGTAYAVITFAGSYYGQVMQKFTIKPVNVSELTVDQKSSVTYAKDGISGLINYVKYIDQTIDEGRDYSLSKISLNKKKMTATVTLKGKGNYSGSRVIYAGLIAKDISDDSTITLSVQPPVVSSKAGVYKPVGFAVMENGTLLSNGTDYKYTITYADGSAVSTKTKFSSSDRLRLTVTGQGYFTGKKSVCYSPVEAYSSDIATISVTAADVSYQNKAGICKPKLTITNAQSGRKLTAGKEYNKQITYLYENETSVSQYDKKTKTSTTITRAALDVVDGKDIIPAGTKILALVKGAGNYSGLCATAEFMVGINMAKCSVSLNSTTFTGTQIVPAASDISVSFNGNSVSSPNYEVVAFTQNSSRGTGTVTIRGKNNCFGTKKVNLKINAKNMAE